MALAPQAHTAAKARRAVGRIRARFGSVAADPAWSFADLTTRHTRYATHGYHAYPAKFIPQLAARLIMECSKPGQWVLDPFMGSGTTLVEAKLAGRPSLGVDINPTAHLISVAKIGAVPGEELAVGVGDIAAALTADPGNGRRWPVPAHKRIDYWFGRDTQQTLARILHLVEAASSERVRAFMRCAFSNSLKKCSIWLQRSVKPTRDFDKQIPAPVEVFLRQVRQMEKRNAEFYRLLRERGCLDVPAEAHCADARNLPVEDGAMSLVVTSPPYVTSYEYADLHQLTALWFRYMADLPSFRKPFIGTAHHDEKPIATGSEIADGIVAQLHERRPRTATEVATYFTDMREVFLEVHRALRKGGRACIVVGNTNLVGVDILNAQVFAEQMMGMGFVFERLIEREIPSKILPQVRDKKTGRFTSTIAADYLAYPHEYILVMRKG